MCGANRRGGPVFDTEFLINLLQMFVHRARREAEDLADIPVSLAFGDPQEHVGLAGRQAKVLPQHLVLVGVITGGQPEEIFIGPD